MGYKLNFALAYMTSKFADNLRHFMALRGFDQVRLSKASGVSQGNISKYLYYSLAPRVENLKKLAKALKCSPNQLLGIDGLTLSDDESRLLEAVKQMSDEQRQALLKLLERKKEE